MNESDLNQYFANHVTLSQKQSFFSKHRAGVLLLSHPDLIYSITSYFTHDEQQLLRLVHRAFAETITPSDAFGLQLRKNVDTTLNFIDKTIQWLNDVSQNQSNLYFDFAFEHFGRQLQISFYNYWDNSVSKLLSIDFTCSDAIINVYFGKKIDYNNFLWISINDETDPKDLFKIPFESFIIDSSKFCKDLDEYTKLRYEKFIENNGLMFTKHRDSMNQYTHNKMIILRKKCKPFQPI